MYNFNFFFAMSRKSFSVKEKNDLITEFHKSNLNQKDFAASKNISASTFRTILKKRSELNSAREGTGRKKVRSAKYEEMEAIVKTWFIQARSSNIPVSGPILQEKALQVAKTLGITDFTASTGWLDRFKNRHSIIYRQICGESNSVNPEVTTDWKNHISALISGYDPSEIYNADEFGLFFKLMPDKSLVLKNEKCHGGKLSKERLTVLVCTNSVGTDKKKPLVIGKYAKPRCFKNVKTIPCSYSSQSRAWMTCDQFVKWLNDWDTELKDRKILLLVDNCAAHPKTVNLKNIKLAFLPPNTTSELQPLDQGIIKVLKQGYRRRMVQQFLTLMDSSTTAPPKISILDAIHFLYAAWMDIKEETIANCFKKAGVGNFRSEQEVENVSLSYMYHFFVFKCNFNCLHLHIFNLNRLMMKIGETCYQKKDLLSWKVLMNLIMTL